MIVNKQRLLYKYSDYGHFGAMPVDDVHNICLQPRIYRMRLISLKLTS